MMKYIVLLMVILVFPTAAKENCFPESDLVFSAYEKSSGNISEFEFNQIIDRFTKVWSPFIKKNFGKKLIVEGRWTEAKVNAHATRDQKKNPVIVLLGGMARHPEMTKDGLVFILCHELGHHLGGAPKKFRGGSNKRSWSSAEGQADYFAATKCMRKVFENHFETPFLPMYYSDEEVRSTERFCMDEECKKTLLAGLSVSRVFSSLRMGSVEPSLIIRNGQSVGQTNYKHPDPQCRLETVISGAQCDLGIEYPFDDSKADVGACVAREGDKASMEGARPRCWFAPSKY
ncbi:hypothetical protein HBN50_14420 [Halobacteriovorax sp. GB3]|uniref:hypothetical protein n=1 Tax=Halobacteriovorax sp. GB3 TaxID=2719615 RepID=UPI00235EC0DF|nr:hypothetical protein [Halobacteriovorax sp. GB3]MDD0854304.1 hypothetical protein [Halobacteriovorax sp. GB3]